MENPYDWDWSSARSHLTGEDQSGLLDMDLWRNHFDPRSWQEYLKQAASNIKANDRIRKATTAGRFCGPEEIAKKLEREFRRSVRGKSK